MKVQICAFIFSAMATTAFAAELPQVKVSIGQNKLRILLDALDASAPAEAVKVERVGGYKTKLTVELKSFVLPAQIAKKYYGDKLVMEFVTSPDAVYSTTATIQRESVLGALSLDSNLNKCEEMQSPEYGACNDFSMTRLPGSGLAFEVVSNYGYDLEDDLHLFRMAIDLSSSGRVTWKLFSASLEEDHESCVQCTSSGCSVPKSCTND